MSEPGPGQVLIDVKSAGVNPVNTYIRAGAYAKKPDLPYTPGFDAAKIINAVGTGVEGISIGDRVYAAGTILGSYAEKALCADSQIHRLPDNVPFGQGASIGLPCAIAYHALFRRAKKGNGW